MIGLPNDSGSPAEEPETPGSAGTTRPEGQAAASEAQSSNQEEREREESAGMRFRDRRRIDPETYESRLPDGEPEPGAPESQGENDGQLLGLDAELAGVVAADERVKELTADLKRLSAEYSNYRRRVERDRTLQAELTTAAAMTKLLPILDDVARARDHGELEGGFKSVGEAVESFAQSNGVAAFGAEGEPFDPNFHEAMTSDTGPDVEEPTITRVFQVGYRIDDRVLRAARVGVTDAE